MASALDTTVSGTAANSYATVAEASAYFADRTSGSAKWGASDDDLRRASLIEAARRLDKEDWLGYVTTLDQALAWPRAGLVDREGRFVDQDSIPSFIKNAQCELALWLLENAGGDSDALSAFESFTIGPLSVTPSKGGTVHDLTSEIRRELRPYLRTGRREIKLERA